ncbi:SDR family NAD(P)-dependent oxidoreductase [Arthrobacter sp. Cr_A7]|uniref:SDR family NAD(P)-dependent oxidoreductase n=1 Tax=Arthrobacter sp. Cr_A7 TaxID=3031017 RepID=UPI0023DC2668|nr:SDR family NAD(P)-dependent oxidoreductase [Arthrobacter sp. Cr_A7]MDF2052139.1 SDR family NAD(P)-dependent oxidoreductase [Arthrobacter sp. Cr_A7]
MSELTLSTEQNANRTGKKVWFITGAGRGLGTDIAKAALAAGHAVVATGRNPDKVAQAVGDHENLLTVKLDVTDPADATAAVQAAVDRFGRIDVLVNNAGNFYAGFFEEITPPDFRTQIETTMFGPINVTRAALPVLRAQRSGLLVTISSTAGIRGRRVPHRVRRLKVRCGGLGRVAGAGSSPVRHPVHDRGARVLPH